MQPKDWIGFCYRYCKSRYHVPGDLFMLSGFSSVTPVYDSQLIDSIQDAEEFSDHFNISVGKDTEVSTLLLQTPHFPPLTFTFLPPFPSLSVHFSNPPFPSLGVHFFTHSPPFTFLLIYKISFQFIDKDYAKWVLMSTGQSPLTRSHSRMTIIA